MQEVLEARRKAASSLAALQGLIAPRLQDGSTISAVRESCLASGQPAADGTLQVPSAFVMLLRPRSAAGSKQSGS